MILAVHNIIFPTFDSKITINEYKIRFSQKLRMLPLDWPELHYRLAEGVFEKMFVLHHLLRLIHGGSYWT